MQCIADCNSDAAQKQGLSKTDRAQIVHEGSGSGLQSRAELLKHDIDMTQLRAQCEILRAEAAQAKAQVYLSAVQLSSC